jgi:uncharacterized protein (TIGR02466 family)
MTALFEFSTPIGIFEIKKNIYSNLSDVLLKFVEENDPTSLSFTTNDCLHLDSQFYFLKNYIDQKVKDFSEQTLGIDFNDLKMSCMWGNIQKDNSIHPMHQHPNSFLSGVFYLQIPESYEEGRLVFEDPRTAKNMQFADFKKKSCISDRSIWISPKEGLLVLFPSWLSHGTHRFLSKKQESRMSISFNYIVTKCEYRTMRI